MSQRRRNDRRFAYEEYRRAENEYVYGNTVRKLQPQPQPQPRKQEGTAVRKNRERARYMSAGYVLFLVSAICAAALILVNYIQLRTELTNLTRSVAVKEIEVNNLRMENDEEYNRIISSIDLEEIKRVALGELGMIYAQEGQIVLYDKVSNDYTRKVQEGGH